MVHKVEASASLTESIVTHNFLEPMPQGQKTFECEIRTHFQNYSIRMFLKAL
jgi:hypothetical protein